MAVEGDTREGSSGFTRRHFEYVHSSRRPDRKTTTGKKSIPEPTHVGHFAVMLVMKICRAVLLIDTSVKIGVYLIGVMVGSVLCDLFAFPRSFFSNRRNFFNIFFVKMGWGWTFTLLLIFIFLTSSVYCCGRWNEVKRHIMRLGVGTFWWYLCTKSFEVIDSTVGQCTKPGINSKMECLQSGREWIGLDISGHVFLLIHCLLTISEEVKVFKNWRKIGELLYDDELKDKRKVTDEDISKGRFSLKSHTPIIKAVIAGLALIVILWEFMLLVSVIYRFHTLPQKIVAAFIAVLCWFVSYRILFRSKIPWLPPQPGDSSLSYMKLV
ncbi:acyl-coenzyme A diphosphatase FITM2-like [Haliotis asinina]|uniref:acyl-coenzyme A diphosphatase FITM2-like n=1 Tax=Haliotis asinina TaxID=109174 RepID=UPI0035323859